MNPTRHFTWALWALLLGASTALPAASEDLERGEVLYSLCQQCHGATGVGNQAALAPAIAGLPQWFVEGQLTKFMNGGRGTHFDDLEGMRMRPMAKWLGGEEDKKNVAAYVASMPKVVPPRTIEGDPESGKQKYTPCVACHGVDGLGNQALNAPPLVGMSDWYQVRSLQKFKAGIRGTNPLDTTGMLMRPMSMTLADEQAMRDVVAYIHTLGPKTSAKAE